MASVTRGGALGTFSGSRGLGWFRAVWRSGWIALAVAAASAAVYALGVSPLGGAPDPAMAEMWVLFLVFVVAELYVADARDRSELVALSPHEAGLVLGLFMLVMTFGIVVLMQRVLGRDFMGVRG